MHWGFSIQQESLLFSAIDISSSFFGEAEKVEDSFVLFIFYLAKSLREYTTVLHKKISHGYFNHLIKCLILLQQFSYTMNWFLWQMGQYCIIVQKLTFGHTPLKKHDLMESQFDLQRMSDHSRITGDSFVCEVDDVLS